MRMLRVGLRLSVLAAQRSVPARLALGLRSLPAVAPRFALSPSARPFATTPRAYANAGQKGAPQTEAGAASEEKSENPEKPQLLKNEKGEEVAESKEPKPKLTLWQKVKKEVKHYWEGTKLLGYEIKVSTKLAFKLASGRELSRREDRQLKRTIQDIVRVVPFSVFVLVPFAELLLPVALKLFPNMLPSVYETSSAKKKKAMKLGKTRSDVGSYLRDTIKHDKMNLPEFKSKEQRAEFDEFFRQIRDGEKPDKDRMLTVARMFKDDMLLDNLTRPQLAGIARYMNLQSFGTSIILRYQIRHRMRMIKQDDRVIEYEGVDALNTLELQNACQSRGFKVYGVSSGRLRDDLTNWLQLRLHDRVPSTLLVLSSAYTYSGEHNIESMYDGVLNVLSALPPEVYHEAELEVSSDEATNAQRLEVLKEQDELIRDENKEEQESGHVVQVRDDLNVDDEERFPQPTESEADAKADLDWYREADKKDKDEKAESVFTESKAAEKDDNEWLAAQNRPRKPQPTEAEENAKAELHDEDPLREKNGKSVGPQPTEAEENAKADMANVDPLAEKKHKVPQPTEAEEHAKADLHEHDPLKEKHSKIPQPTEAEEHAKAELHEHDPLKEKRSKIPQPTEAEEHAKAELHDHDPLREKKLKAQGPQPTEAEENAKADLHEEDPLKGKKTASR